jgi:hypothetical protein
MTEETMFPSFKASFLVPVRNAANTLALFLAIPLAGSVALLNRRFPRRLQRIWRAAENCSKGSAPVVTVWTGLVAQGLV